MIDAPKIESALAAKTLLEAGLPTPVQPKQADRRNKAGGQDHRPVRDLHNFSAPSHALDAEPASNLALQLFDSETCERFGKGRCGVGITQRVEAPLTPVIVADGIDDGFPLLLGLG